MPRRLYWMYLNGSNMKQFRVVNVETRQETVMDDPDQLFLFLKDVYPDGIYHLVVWASMSEPGDSQDLTREVPYVVYSI